MNEKKLLLFSFGAATMVGAILYFALRDDPQVQQASRTAVSALASPGSKAALSDMKNPLPIQPRDNAQAPTVNVDRLLYNRESFKAAALSERLRAMSSRRQGHAFDPEEVAAALQSDVAWTNDPSIADQLSLSQEERRDGREFIRVNPIKIEALMPGDEISIPLRQVKPEAALRMVVDRIEESPGENLTWHGHLKDFDSENQVSFTRGESLIVGGVITPDKNYVVQIYGDAGWVVDGFAIFKGKHDAVIPPADGRAPSLSKVGHSH